jgi:hypothetical protein
MTHAKEPNPQSLWEALRAEIDGDAKVLGPALYGNDPWDDAHEIVATQYRQYFRDGYMHGLPQMGVSPEVWIGRQRERSGDAQFIEDVLDAFPEIDRGQLTAAFKPMTLERLRKAAKEADGLMNGQEPDSGD